MICSPLENLFERSERFAAGLFASAAETDVSTVIDACTWKAFHDAGLGVAALPTHLGGHGLCEPRRHVELCRILALLGAGDLSIARLFEGHVNAIDLVHRYGSPAQLDDLARSVVAGELSAVWGADDSSGLHLVRTADHLVLMGRKILASGAGFVSRPLITTAKDGEGGQLLCLLTMSEDHAVDLSGWLAQGMRSTATGSVQFTGHRITPDNIIGAAGDFMRQPHFSGGAWRFCAAHLGAMERLVDLFRDHLVATHRDKDSYQLQRLAQCATAARTARFWVEEAARRLATKAHEPAAVVAFANFTRMVTERSALDIMQTVQRGVGLSSFVRPNPIERICRDLSTYLRQPVPDLAMSDAARALLDSELSVGAF